MGRSSSTVNAYIGSPILVSNGSTDDTSTASGVPELLTSSTESSGSKSNVERNLSTDARTMTDASRSGHTSRGRKIIMPVKFKDFVTN
jgi:hypothetical protein